MSVRVLVVDDSGFFRRRIIEILEADARIEVIGGAANGREAIQKVMDLKPDVVTMDIEMPEMDGITAVRRIMAMKPTPILMFSSLSYEGAQSTFEALEAGAVDYLPKRFDEFSKDREEAKQLLRNRVWTIGIGRHATAGTAQAAVAGARSQPAARLRSAAPAAPARTAARTARTRIDCQLVAIGSSTGGPQALQTVLPKLPANFSRPILLIQHMPGTFTPAFAKRLDQQCEITVKEAEDGDLLRAGHAYLAPGGKQMTLEQRRGNVIIRIEDGDQKLNYKPCVDITLQSVAEIYPGKVLGVILTGMGADGREGGRALKRSGSVLWAQDEATSVIYGMPMAVVEADLADEVLPLQEIGPLIAKSV